MKVIVNVDYIYPISSFKFKWHSKKKVIGTQSGQGSENWVISVDRAILTKLVQMTDILVIALSGWRI